MELTHFSMPSTLPVFGNTRLERSPASRPELTANFLVRVPFVGVAQGELRIWCDLDLNRIRSHEQAFARGVLLETANILAGVSLSDLADRMDGRIMLAPPILVERKCQAPNEGTDYHLHLLEGHCNCRVELVSGGLA